MSPKKQRYKPYSFSAPGLKLLLDASFENGIGEQKTITAVYSKTQ